MPQTAWNAKRERQYAHIRDSLLRRGGLHSHSGAQGRTLAQLQNEARQRGVKGRSSMNKAQLEAALKR